MTQKKKRIKVLPDFEPFIHNQTARYWAAFGGRGSGKSHFFAEHLVSRCVRKQTRAVCIREVQSSIKESVKQLLEDKIEALGFGNNFQVLESEIRGVNGSLIVFKGMKSYNAENIKSLEGFDIAWFEEAQTASQKSLDLLRPTIRKAGSQLWFGWNPVHDTDPIDEFFRGDNPPSNSVIVRAHFSNNRFLSDELKEEEALDRQSRPIKARHIWDGGYDEGGEGMFNADKVRKYTELPAFAKNGVRYWDLASTEPHKGNKDPDWSAGAKVYFFEGQWYLEDMKTIRKESDEVEQLMKNVSDWDGQYFPVAAEQEGGSSGKGYLSLLSRTLMRGRIFTPVPKRKSKIEAARILESAINNGNFFVRDADWAKRFIAELKTFPGGKHDDQIDAVSGAMNKLIEEPQYDDRDEVEYYGM